MKKLIYAALAVCVVCIAFADDHIIQFVLSNGQHISFRTSEVKLIGYDYHNQDSIDKAYADSVRAEFVKDSLYRDSLRLDSLKKDSIGRTQTVGYQMDSLSQYALFTAALKLTGLYDSLNIYTVRRFEEPKDKRDTSYGYTQLFAPTTSRNGFTLFVEPDSVMKAYGINSIDDLIVYANQTYGGATEWYDYLAESNLKVSTGTDYTSPQNALHMFVAYHILKSAMPVDQLVYERNGKWMGARVWNYCNDGQPYDYYETMLPHTLMKIWQPQPMTSTKQLYINRYVANNTLTDEVASYGSAAMHEVLSQGVLVDRSGEVSAFNGYIHGLQGMLVYDRQVPRGVLHERMRFNFASQLPEMSNNGWRFLTQTEASNLNSGGSGARLAFPNDYFENIRVYDPETCLRYNVKGAYALYQSDCIQGWGYYDLAVKLPPLPSGVYEMRIMHTPMAHGGVMEYSLLPDADDIEGVDAETRYVTVRNSLVLDSIDLTIDKEDPRIGWTNFTEEEDQGIASDKALRERGYMRGPFSFYDHPERQDGGYDRSMRYTTTGNNTLRRILGRITVKQGTDNWLRVRTLSHDNYDAKFLLDYVEFVPVDVVDNEQYMEDWY